MRKRWKKQLFSKIIHIIHIERTKIGGLFIANKRTSVLWTCDKNNFLSKKAGKCIDF